MKGKNLGRLPGRPFYHDKPPLRRRLSTDYAFLPRPVFICLPRDGHNDDVDYSGGKDRSCHYEADLGNELRPLAVNKASAFFTLLMLGHKHFMRNHLEMKKALFDGKMSGFFTRPPRESFMCKHVENVYSST